MRRNRHVGCSGVFDSGDVLGANAPRVRARLMGFADVRIVDASSLESMGLLKMSIWFCSSRV